MDAMTWLILTESYFPANFEPNFRYVFVNNHETSIILQCL